MRLVSMVAAVVVIAQKCKRFLTFFRCYYDQHAEGVYAHAAKDLAIN